LGEFLFESVKRYRKEAQTPRFGKLGDPVLNRGDFVFRVSAPGREPEPEPGKAPGFTVIASSDGKQLGSGDTVEIGSRIALRVRAVARGQVKPGFAWLLASDDGGVRVLSPQVKVASPA